MTEIYTIMTKVHYRLSNGAGSKKEILVCGLFLSMQSAMKVDMSVKVSYQLPCQSPTSS